MKICFLKILILKKIIAKNKNKNNNNNYQFIDIYIFIKFYLNKVQFKENHKSQTFSQSLDYAE